MFTCLAVWPPLREPQLMRGQVEVWRVSLQQSRVKGSVCVYLNSLTLITTLAAMTQNVQLRPEQTAKIWSFHHIRMDMCTGVVYLYLMYL